MRNLDDQKALTKLASNKISTRNDFAPITQKTHELMYSKDIELGVGDLGGSSGVISVKEGVGLRGSKISSPKNGVKPKKRPPLD